VFKTPSRYFFNFETTWGKLPVLINGVILYILLKFSERNQEIGLYTLTLFSDFAQQN